MENLDNGSLARDEADLILDEMDQEITAVAAKMADLEIDLRRQEVFDIVEERINENQAVDIYDVARAGEVSPGVLNGVDKIQGSESQIAAAMNALGHNVSPLRLVIGLLMMGMGIGLMIYGFLQNKKVREHNGKVIDDLRKASENIRNNPIGIKITRIDIGAYSAARKRIAECPEAVKMFDNQIKPLWKKITGEELDLKIMSFTEQMSAPWASSYDKLTELKSTFFFDKLNPVTLIDEYYSRLEKDLKALIATTERLIKQTEATVNHLAAGTMPKAEGSHWNPSISPSFSPKPATGDFIIAKFYYVDGLMHLIPSHRAHFKMSQEQLATAQGLARIPRTNGPMPLDLEGANSAIALCLNPPPIIAALTKQLSDIEKSATDQLEKFEAKTKTLTGENAAFFRTYCTEIRASLKGLIEYQQTQNTASLQIFAAANSVAKYIIHSNEYNELMGKFDKLVSDWAKDVATKTGGLNALELENGEEALAERISTGRIDAEDFGVLLDVEEDKQYRLQAIHDRVKETGLISRADIKEAEEIEPSLLSDLPSRPVFTFQPSTVGYEAGLNSIGEKLKGFGIFVVFLFGIAAVLLAVLAIIGKLMNGSRSTVAKLEDNTKRIQANPLSEKIDQLQEAQSTVNNAVNKPTPNSAIRPEYKAFNKMKHTWRLITGKDMESQFKDYDAWFKGGMKSPWESQRTEALDQLRSDMFFNPLHDDSVVELIEMCEERANELLKSINGITDEITKHIKNTEHAISNNDMDGYFERLGRQIKDKDGGALTKIANEFNEENVILATAIMKMFPLVAGEAITKYVPDADKKQILADAEKSAQAVFPSDFIAAKFQAVAALTRGKRLLGILTQIAEIEKRAANEIKSISATKLFKIHEVPAEKAEIIIAKNKLLKDQLDQISTQQKLMADFEALSLRRADAYCHFVDDYCTWGSELDKLVIEVEKEAK